MKNGFSVELNIGGRILEYDDDKGLLYCKIPQQRMADPKKLSFGIVSNQAEVDLEDFDGKLKKLFTDKKINQSTKCKILFNNHLMFYGIVNDSDYSSDNKTLSIKVADPLILLKGIKCKPKEFDNGNDAAEYLLSCAKSKLAALGVIVSYEITGYIKANFTSGDEYDTGELGFVVKGTDIYNDIDTLACTTQRNIYMYKDIIVLCPSVTYVTYTGSMILYSADIVIHPSNLLSNISSTLVPDNQIERVDLDVYYDDVTARDEENVFKSSNKIETNYELINQSYQTMVSNTFPESLPLPYNGDSIAIRRFELRWSPDITRTYTIPPHQGNSTIVSITDIENAITQNKANVTIGFYGKTKPFSITTSQQKILESLSANGYLLSQDLKYEDGQEGYTDFVELSRWNIGTKTLADYVSLSEDDDGNIIVTSKINPTRIAVVSGTVAFPKGITYPAFAFTNSYELIPEGIALKIKDGDVFHIVKKEKASSVSYGDTTKDAFTLTNSQFTTSSYIRVGVSQGGSKEPLDKMVANNILSMFKSGKKVYTFDCEFSEYADSFFLSQGEIDIIPKHGKFVNVGFNMAFDTTIRKELGIPDAGLASDGNYDATIERVDVINDRGHRYMTISALEAK